MLAAGRTLLGCPTRAPGQLYSRSCLRGSAPLPSPRSLQTYATLLGRPCGNSIHQPVPLRFETLAVHASKGSKGSQPTGEQESAAKGGSSSAGARAAAKRAQEEEDEEDGFLDEEGGEWEEDEGEYEEGDEGEEEEDEEGGDDYSSFLEPDDAPREVATGDTDWGETVLRSVREVLAQPAMQGLGLYLFRALPGSRKVDIRLDKLADVYGSPSIDDIERFQRALFAALDRALGEEAAGDISFEVSSPGAEREVAVPGELERFGGLPLRVEYRGPDGKDATAVLIMNSMDAAAGTSAWRLANVRANATVKGRALSKRQLAATVAIPLADLRRVRIHVDF